jgi:hypoxanthine-DNA glycosylase
MAIEQGRLNCAKCKMKKASGECRFRISHCALYDLHFDIMIARPMAERVSKRPLICSFPPIAARDARVLVLGTMPSIASLAARQYYAHPQNAFWRIMGELFGAGRDVPYAARKAILRRRGVAVWDVLRECHRPGSLDSSIVGESESPNDFETFFRRHAEITTVFFNGQKAQSLFRRHALENIESLGRNLRFVRLPSTSPAHAGRTFAQKLKAWRAVAEALGKH